MAFTPLKNGAPDPNRKSFTRSFLAAPKAPSIGGTSSTLKATTPNRGAAGGPPKPTKPTFAGGVSKADDGVIHQVNVARKKTPTQRRIAHQKKAQAVISITGGTLGLTALATRGRSAQLTRRAIRIPDQADGLVQRAGKLKDRSTAITTAGAGVGGVGAFNFASYTNAESNKVRKSQMDPWDEEVEKALAVPKSLSVAVGNFRNGMAKPEGVNGVRRMTSRAGRAGQFVGRRAVAQSEAGAISRTVDRVEQAAAARGRLTPVKKLPKPKQNGTKPTQRVGDGYIGAGKKPSQPVADFEAKMADKGRTPAKQSGFGRGVALGTGAGVVGSFGGALGYEAYKNRNNK